MKKYFLLMSGLLLSVCGFVACSDDDTTPAPEPTFPELVTKTAEAGEVIELSFSANYDWAATISEDTYTYFQLLSGETAVNTLSGVAGEQTIKVKVADEVIFENAPVAEVTLTMNEISQVIAQITYPTTARETAVYAPMLNQYSGAFQGGTYGGELLYSYNETAMTADDVVAMQWGTERGNNNGEDTFFAPVLVTTNFAYTLAGPAWMAAAEEGAAGTTEYVIKADATQIPAESETATIDVLAGEEVIASFKVAITGADDFVPQLALSGEAEYAFDGEAINGGLMGNIVVGNFVKVVCDATGAVAEWLTVTETAEGDAAIKTYEVSATAAANEGTEARTAYVFYFAANAAPAADAELFDAEGNVKEEYSESLASVVTQYTEPATISVNGWLDDTCTTFAEAGADIDYWFTEGALRNLFIGSKYDISYFGEWAEYGSDNSFVTSRPVASFKTYAYTLAGSFVELAEDAWAWGESFYTDEEITRFKIQTNLNASTAEGAQNWLTGDYESVILVEYTDGTYSAIYFHYGAAASGGGDDITEVTFVDPMTAGMYGATLVQLTEADTELYDPSAVDAMGNPIPQYHLTYKYAGTVLPLSVPSYDFAYPQAEWIMHEGTNTELYIGMMTEEAAISVLNFYKNNVVSVRIVCEFAPMTEDGGDDDIVEDIDFDSQVLGTWTYEKWTSGRHTGEYANLTPYRDHGMGAASWGYTDPYTVVELAADCIEGRQSKNGDGTPGNPKDGQRYGSPYCFNMHVFYDIESKEINPTTWEYEEGTGCYAIINLIDRSTASDPIPVNYSYFDAKNGIIYWDFILIGSSGTEARLFSAKYTNRQAK